MATDEDIQRFVSENREMVERMMKVQKDSLRMASGMGKEAIESSRKAAEFARDRSEEFVRTTYGMISSPEVQRHFMTAGMEFLAGLTAMAGLAPVPGFMKDAASDFERNARAAACKANESCPMRVRAKTVTEEC